VLVWHITQLTGLPVLLDGVMTDINALSDSNIWLFGGNTTSGGRSYPLVEHWDGTGWKRVKVSGSFTLQGGHPIPDGGGFWVTTGWDTTGVPPHLLHFSNGAFTRVSLPKVGGRFVASTG
jgi:hypothetical protein